MRRGVGFVLSRRATEAWNAAGNVLCEPSSSTRVLGLKLVFEDTSKHAATLLAVIDKYLAGSESNVIEDLVDRLCMKQHTKAKITHGDGDYVEKVTFWPKGVCSTGEPFVCNRSKHSAEPGKWA